MKLKREYVLDALLIITLIILLFNRGIGKGEEVNKEVNLNTEKVEEVMSRFFPGGEKCKLGQDSIWQIYDGEGAHLGALIDSRPYGQNNYGFGGPTPILIATDTEYKVLGVEIVDHNETPSYIKLVTRKGFFNQWNDLSLREALQKPVDVVSGASMTSNAVAATFHARIARLTDVEKQKDKDYGRWISIACALLLTAIALYAYFRPAVMKAYRIWLLGACVVVLGLWQGIFISLASMEAWLSNGVSLGVHFVLFFLFILSVLLPFFTGKAFYCTWVCPYGAAQELSGKIIRKKIRLPQSLLRFLSGMRPYVLLVVMLLLLLNVVSDLSPFEPFAAFKWRSASAVVLILAGLFLVVSAFVPRAWCRFFCPTGELLDLPRRWNVKRLFKSGKK